MFGLLGLVNKAGKNELKKFGTVVGGLFQGSIIGGYLTSHKIHDTDKLYILINNKVEDFPFNAVQSYNVVEQGRGLRCAIYEIEWKSGKKSLIEFSIPGENNFVKGYNIYRINNH